MNNMSANIQGRKSRKLSASSIAYGVLAAAGLALFISDASASEMETSPNWTVMDFQYIHADFDESGISGNGFGVNNFVQIGEYGLFNVGGGGVKTTVSGWGYRAEVTTATFNLGFGGRYPVSDTTDLFAVAGAAYVRWDYGNFSENDTGFYANTGVRSMVTSNLDLAAYLEHFSIDGASDTGVGFEGRYWFNPRVALSTGVSLDSDVNVFSFGVTVAF